jgi:ribose transport system substrate-binding protein
MKKSFKALAALLLSTLLLGTLVTGCAKSSSTTSSGKVMDPSTIALPSLGHVKVQKVSGKKLTIDFMMFSNNPFWDQVNEGRLAAIKYLSNFNCTVQTTIIGTETTAEAVDTAMDVEIVKHPDAIVVCPMSNGTEVYVNKAVDAGITVVDYLSESTTPGIKRTAFVAQDAAAAGKQAGDFIANYTGGTGEVGVITGLFTMVQHETRRKSMVNELAIKAPNVKIAATVEANDSSETTYNEAKNMITAYPDLKCIYCTAGGPFGAAQAVKEMGKTGKIGVVCYDWVPDNVKYVKTGEIVAALSQDPQGMAFDSTVDAYNHIVTGWKPAAANGFVPTTTNILTPQNIAQLLPNS